MPNDLNSVPDLSEPLSYQIRIKGHLDPEWADWFGGLSITLDGDGTTRLVSPAIDQAALHGLLKKVRDLGLPLLSINSIEPDRAAVTAAGQNQSLTEGCEE